MYPAIKDSKFLLKGLKIYKVTSRQGNSSNVLYVCVTFVYFESVIKKITWVIIICLQGGQNRCLLEGQKRFYLRDKKDFNWGTKRYFKGETKYRENKTIFNLGTIQFFTGKANLFFFLGGTK